MTNCRELSIEDFASRAGITPPAVRDLIRLGVLKAEGESGSFRIPQPELDRYMRKYLSVEAFANEAGLAPDSVVRLIDRNLVQDEKHGDSVRIPRSELRRYMREHSPTIPQCSFCHTAEKERRMLIAGPNGVFICDQCIVLVLTALTEDHPLRLEVLDGSAVRKEQIQIGPARTVDYCPRCNTYVVTLNSATLASHVCPEGR